MWKVKVECLWTLKVKVESESGMFLDLSSLEGATSPSARTGHAAHVAWHHPTVVTTAREHGTLVPEHCHIEPDGCTETKEIHTCEH